MQYLHQDKTLQKAREFADYLQAREFRAVPDLDGIRDYLAKIDLYAAGLYIGKLNLYYSPKKDNYSITFQQLKIPAYRAVLEEHWQDFRHGHVNGAYAGKICAYVDGSFLAGHIGYGAVIVKDGRILQEISGSMEADHNAYRQIAGELKAVLETLKWCKAEGIGDIHVFYDYKGIEMWATGRWKAKKPLTQAYQAYMIRQDIRVHYHKIAAHSGDRWNDHADMLAKRGAGNEKSGPPEEIDPE